MPEAETSKAEQLISAAKAQRRRMMKAHNYRMPARGIKQQREDSRA